MSNNSSGAFAPVSKAISMLRIVLEKWPELGTPKQVEYLAGRLEAERSSREASKRAALLRRCALPAPKAFDGYDWSAVSWPEGMGRESLLALDFVERREDLVLMGDVGTGKTRMASALCALACERRLEARLFAASSLVMRMGAPAMTGSPAGWAALIGRASLLVIDELGFLPLDADGARPLFRAFADAHERRSAAITTNLEFGRWGSVFGDDRMAAAVIDRSSTTGGSSSSAASPTASAMPSCVRAGRSKARASDAQAAQFPVLCLLESSWRNTRQVDPLTALDDVLREEPAAPELGRA